MTRFLQGVHCLVYRRIDVQGKDIDARDHNFPHQCVSKAKDRDDHLLFFLLQDSFFLSCFNKTYQLSLSYPTFLVRF